MINQMDKAGSFKYFYLKDPGQDKLVLVSEIVNIAQKDKYK
jgi:hypothetical protein